MQWLCQGKTIILYHPWLGHEPCPFSACGTGGCRLHLAEWITKSSSSAHVHWVTPTTCGMGVRISDVRGS